MHSVAGGHGQRRIDAIGSQCVAEHHSGLGPGVGVLYAVHAGGYCAVACKAQVSKLELVGCALDVTAGAVDGVDAARFAIRAGGRGRADVLVGRENVGSNQLGVGVKDLAGGGDAANGGDAGSADRGRIEPAGTDSSYAGVDPTMLHYLVVCPWGCRIRRRVA
jgi:hypothetical protein